MRGMPQIYSGDEIAMRGGEDPDNRRDFPGGFSSGPGNSSLKVFPKTCTQEQQQTFATVKALLIFRRSNPALLTSSRSSARICFCSPEAPGA